MVSSLRDFVPSRHKLVQGTDRVSEMKDEEQTISARRGVDLDLGAAVSAGAPERVSSARRSTARTQDIDRHVGGRVRERRIMLGLT